MQLAGGLRSREQAETWLDRGAGQVVIGTRAATAPDEVKTLAKSFPDTVVLSLDVAGDTLKTHGWTSDSWLSPRAMLDSFADAPLAGVVITDIDADAGVDKQLGVITALAAATRHPVFASGLVDSLDDLSRLRYVPNIAGAIVGRALMKKTFTLEEARAVAQTGFEPVAEFR